MKKKTHEEYVTELASKNPNVEVIGEYVGTKTKILHRCKIDGYEWEAKPNNILSGKNCPKCAGHLKKTHEEYVNKLEQINSNIEVLGKYINSQTSILHKCTIDNYEWYASPSSILRGTGCPKCAGNIRKTHEEYVGELTIVNSNIEVIEKYQGANTSILHRCKIDGHEWNTAPTRILSGVGCPKCAGNAKKTHKYYIEELSIKNQDIEVIGGYINANTPILHRCKKHNIQWMAQPSSILQGCGCKLCGKEKLHKIQTKTHKKYIEEIRKITSDIEVVGEYQGSNLPIKHYCKKHNMYWFTSPVSILQGCGCAECGKEKLHTLKVMTHEQYVKKLSIENPDILVIDEYIDSKTPILHKCKIDGYKWYAKPANILFGRGCPQCHESHGERYIRQWLEKHDIEYVFQKPFKDCCDINPLPFDFYLPHYNCCIEYDHKQHYEPIEYFGGEEKFKIQQKHDNIKNEYCKENGITLLRIPYYKNIEEELNNFLFI